MYGNEATHFAGTSSNSIKENVLVILVVQKLDH